MLPPDDSCGAQEMQEVAVHQICLKMNKGYKQSRKRIWPQKAELHMKGMNLVSSKACIFLYIEEH